MAGIQRSSKSRRLTGSLKFAILEACCNTHRSSQMTTQIVFENGKWVGLANGVKVVKSYDQTRVVKMMAKAGYRNVAIKGEDVTAEVEEDTQSQWDINTRFDFVTQLVDMVARNKAVSLIVTGPGGLGKTHTVRAALESAGLKDASGFDAETAEGSFKMIKGYSTAKGLYRELFYNRDSVIVFDDTDSILKDPVALNLLKGALDSYDKRIISWNADMKDDDLPRSFVFNGRVIFISNLKRSQMDNALKTRAYVIDLAMNLQQKIDRMAVLAASEEFMPQMPVKYKQDALKLIQDMGNRAKEVSLRSLQAVTRIRAAGGNWRALAEYTLTN